MKKDILFFSGITLLTIILLAFFYFATFKDKSKKAVNTNTSLQPNLTLLNVPTVNFGNPMRGAKNPKITIVEFGNYLCAPCAAMETALAQLNNDFPNQIRFVWKDLPEIEASGATLEAAMAARCAERQNNFWEYHDLLFINQGQAFETTNLQTFANLLKLDAKAFTNCLEQSSTKPIIDRDIEEAIRLRVDATPYLFIGSERVSGALDYESLKQLVASEINKVGKK